MVTAPTPPATSHKFRNIVLAVVGGAIGVYGLTKLQGSVDISGGMETAVHATFVNGPVAAYRGVEKTYSALTSPSSIRAYDDGECHVDTMLYNDKNVPTHRATFDADGTLKSLEAFLDSIKEPDGTCIMNFGPETPIP